MMLALGLRHSGSTCPASLVLGNTVFPPRCSAYSAADVRAGKSALHSTTSWCICAAPRIAVGRSLSSSDASKWDARSDARKACVLRMLKRVVCCRRAQRIGPNPRFRRSSTAPCAVYISGWRTDCPGCCDHLAAPGLGEAVIRRFSNSASHHRRSGCAHPQLTSGRPRRKIRFPRPKRRNVDPWGRNGPDFRHGEPQRPGVMHRATMHAWCRPRRRAARPAVIAHDVIAHRRMADERADIHPRRLSRSPCTGPPFPRTYDGAQHLHRNGFDIEEKFGQPFFAATGTGVRPASICR